MRFCNTLLNQWLCAAALLSGTATAQPAVETETGYISERLYLGLYAEPDMSSPPIKTLVSGTAVEIIDQQGDFVQLRLADNTAGWARAEFITQDVPAKLALQQLRTEHQKLQQQLDRGQTDSDKEVKSLQQRLTNATNNVTDLRKRLKIAEQKAAAEEEKQVILRLTDQLSDSQNTIHLLRTTLDATRKELVVKRSADNLPLKILWLLISMLTACGLGVALGFIWHSARVRRRFNGLKVW